MLREPFVLLAALAAIVALVFRLERLPALEPIFRRLPSIFWVYMLPMVATSVGLLPDESPLYGVLTRHLLPASLVLILLSSDLRMILRLGPRALGAMLAAVVGVGVGAIVAFLLLGRLLGPEAWKGLAALVGTWTGGSANLLAVATSLGLSPDAQGIAIVVDTIVGYGWMGILIALSARQAALDRRLRADRREVGEIGRRIADRLERDRRPTTTADATLLVGVALVVAAGGMAIGRALPPVGDVLTPYAWGILTVTTLGLLLSLTPLAKYDGAGASSLGYAGFYLLLAAVGAQADLKKVVAQPLWIVAGVIILAVHAIVLLSALRLMRAPSFFLGAASQASTGGYSSAPVVAEIYQPGLAPVGLLLAVVGNVVGTYLGLAVGQLLAYLSR
ncbi:MAG: DUF819 family protein [Acidobacteria bacterium]|nr:DUF819 family protein [Acidobacteriota bacterium]